MVGPGPSNPFENAASKYSGESSGVADTSGESLRDEAIEKPVLRDGATNGEATKDGSARGEEIQVSILSVGNSEGGRLRTFPSGLQRAVFSPEDVSRLFDRNLEAHEPKVILAGFPNRTGRDRTSESPEQTLALLDRSAQPKLFNSESDLKTWLKKAAEISDKVPEGSVEKILRERLGEAFHSSLINSIKSANYRTLDRLLNTATATQEFNPSWGAAFLKADTVLSILQLLPEAKLRQHYLRKWGPYLDSPKSITDAINYIGSEHAKASEGEKGDWRSVYLAINTLRARDLYLARGKETELDPAELSLAFKNLPDSDARTLIEFINPRLDSPDKAAGSHALGFALRNLSPALVLELSKNLLEAPAPSTIESVSEHIERLKANQTTDDSLVNSLESLQANLNAKLEELVNYKFKQAIKLSDQERDWLVKSPVVGNRMLFLKTSETTDLKERVSELALATRNTSDSAMKEIIALAFELTSPNSKVRFRSELLTYNKWILSPDLKQHIEDLGSATAEQNRLTDSPLIQSLRIKEVPFEAISLEKLKEAGLVISESSVEWPRLKKDVPVPKVPWRYDKDKPSEKDALISRYFAKEKETSVEYKFPDGLTIVLSKSYAAKLNEVRALRLVAAGTNKIEAEKATKQLGRHPLGQAILPEFVWHKARTELPSNNLVRTIEMRDLLHVDELVISSSDKGLMTISGSIGGKDVVLLNSPTISNPYSISWVLRHEYAHLAEKVPSFAAFKAAQDAEGIDGFFLREYAKKNTSEAFAVHAGEEWLNPDPEKFMALCKRAPARSIAIAAVFKEILSRSDNVDSTQNKAIAARIAFVEETVLKNFESVILNAVTRGDLSRASRQLIFLKTLAESGRSDWVKTISSSPEFIRAQQELIHKHQSRLGAEVLSSLIVANGQGVSPEQRALQKSLVAASQEFIKANLSSLKPTEQNQSKTVTQVVDLSISLRKNGHADAAPGIETLLDLTQSSTSFNSSPEAIKRLMSSMGSNQDIEKAIAWFKTNKNAEPNSLFLRTALTEIPALGARLAHMEIMLGKKQELWSALPDAVKGLSDDDIRTLILGPLRSKLQEKDLIETLPWLSKELFSEVTALLPKQLSAEGVYRLMDTLKYKEDDPEEGRQRFKALLDQQLPGALDRLRLKWKSTNGADVFERGVLGLGKDPIHRALLLTIDAQNQNLSKVDFEGLLSKASDSEKVAYVAMASVLGADSPSLRQTFADLESWTTVTSNPQLKELLRLGRAIVNNSSHTLKVGKHSLTSQAMLEGPVLEALAGNSFFFTIHPSFLKNYFSLAKSVGASDAHIDQALSRFRSYMTARIETTSDDSTKYLQLNSYLDILARTSKSSPEIASKLTNLDLILNAMPAKSGVELNTLNLGSVLRAAANQDSIVHKIDQSSILSEDAKVELFSLIPALAAREKAAEILVRRDDLRFSRLGTLLDGLNFSDQEALLKTLRGTIEKAAPFYAYYFQAMPKDLQHSELTRLRMLNDAQSLEFLESIRKLPTFEKLPSEIKEALREKQK